MIIITAVDKGYGEMAAAMMTSVAKNSPGYETKIFHINNNWKAAHNIKPFVILECFEQGHKQVLWLDADIIVRKPLKGIWRGGDIRIIQRPLLSKDFKVNTGVIVIKKKAIPLIKEWKKIIGKAERKRIYNLDQRTFWKAYKKCPEIKLSSLQMKYNDNLFRDDSVIWHAKGHCRQREEWKTEYKKYA